MKQKIILIAASAICLLGQNFLTNKKTNNTMENSIEKNKEVVRNLVEQVLNKRNTAMAKELIASDYVSPQGAKGPESFLNAVKPVITAFPDIEWKIEELVAEHEKVVVRWKWQGTHKAAFNNFPATGKTFTNDGMAIFRLKNAKVISNFTLTDRFGFMEQMQEAIKDRAQ